MNSRLNPGATSWTHNPTYMNQNRGPPHGGMQPYHPSPQHFYDPRYSRPVPHGYHRGDYGMDNRYESNMYQRNTPVLQNGHPAVLAKRARDGGYFRKAVNLYKSALQRFPKHQNCGYWHMEIAEILILELNEVEHGAPSSTAQQHLDAARESGPGLA